MTPESTRKPTQPASEEICILGSENMRCLDCFQPIFFFWTRWMGGGPFFFLEQKYTVDMMLLSFFNSQLCIYDIYIHIYIYMFYVSLPVCCFLLFFFLQKNRQLDELF